MFRRMPFELVELQREDDAARGFDGERCPRRVSYREYAITTGNVFPFFCASCAARDSPVNLRDSLYLSAFRTALEAKYKRFLFARFSPSGR